MHRQRVCSEFLLSSLFPLSTVVGKHEVFASEDEWLVDEGIGYRFLVQMHQKVESGFQSSNPDTVYIEMSNFCDLKSGKCHELTHI